MPQFTDRLHFAYRCRIKTHAGAVHFNRPDDQQGPRGSCLTAGHTQQGLVGRAGPESARDNRKRAQLRFKIPPHAPAYLLCPNNLKINQSINHCCPVNLDHKRKSAQIQVKGTVLRLAE
jgi:hypothetical protein